MRTRPFTISLLPAGGPPSEWDNHIVRRLSSMRGQYRDEAAFERQLSGEDSLIYEVFELIVPNVEGELLHGISIVHPGLVGDEYYMTKGHYHEVLETAEVYYCQRGEGMMIMETPEGEWDVQELRPGSVLYVPPRWAHRSVNTSLSEDLITFFVYPGNAGHNYGTIEQRGFRKQVLVSRSGPVVVDNPRWVGVLAEKP